MIKKFFYKEENYTIFLWNISINNNLVEIESGFLGQKLKLEVKEFSTYKESFNFFENEITDKNNFIEIHKDKFDISQQLVNIMGNLDDLGYAKIFYIPITKIGKGNSIDSKFGGNPYLMENELYPLCKYCNKPFTFFFQINFEKLNKDLKASIGLEEGMIQLFYCTDECFDNDNYLTSQLARYIDKKDIFNNDNINIPLGTNIFTEKVICEWENSGYEYPYEWEGLGDISDRSSFKLNDKLKYTNKIPKIFNYYINDNPSYQEDFKYIYEHKEIMMCFFLCDKDKLGGNPFWVQSPDECYCSECNKKMIPIFQLSSEDNIPYMFGDGGVGHFFICLEHKKAHFFWTCS
ncbi:MAG: DUF1963 domain-containing protein [Candidatus Sericytochromatia bacterium]